MSIKSSIENYKWRVKNYIQDFKDSPVETIGNVIPMVMKGITIIGFVVAYIMFLREGVYAKQAEMVSNKSYWAAFTIGTVPIMYHKILTTIIGILCVVESIIMLISFFMWETKGKKRLLTTCIIIGIIGALAILSLYILEPYTTRDKIRAWGIPIIWVLCIAALLSGILLIIAKSNKFLFVTLRALLFCYAVVPVVLAFVENIIPLFFLAIALVALFVFLKFFVSDKEGGTSSSYESSAPKPRADSKPEPRKEESPQGRICRYASSCKVFLHQETLGTYVYVCDYAGLYSTNDKPELKTKILYSDFKSGKIIIEVGYKRVQESDLIRNFFPY